MSVCLFQFMLSLMGTVQADKRRQCDISAQSAEGEHRAASYLQPDFDLIQEELAGNDADGYLPDSSYDNFNFGQEPLASAPCQVNELAHDILYLCQS